MRELTYQSFILVFILKAQLYFPLSLKPSCEFDFDLLAI
jgi:hypothetical protein